MRLAWHEMTFNLPDDWEVTRYSIAAPVGRFEFANRGGSLGRVCWERSARVPDAERTLVEYHRRYVERNGGGTRENARAIHTAGAGAFLVGYRHEGEPCQAITYLRHAETVVLWVFPDYTPERLECVWKPLLESFKANTGAWREWSCFGMRCRLPRAFDVEEAACRPGDAWLAFQHPSLQRVDLHRWGLPRELLRGRDLPAFAAHVLRGSGARVIESRSEDWRGMASVRLAIETRGTRGMDRLFASWWRGQARFWHDTGEKRMYALIQAGPRKVPPLEESEVLPT